MKKSPLGGDPTICSPADQQDIAIHCYVGKKHGSTHKIISDERVQVKGIRFFISGTNNPTLPNQLQE
jgi:hypothetical protein